MHAIGLDTCVREAAKAIAWDEPKVAPGNERKTRGKGLAAMWNPVVILPLSGSGASVLLDAESGCTITVGGVESGQGVNTLAVQLVSAELGVPQDWVRIRQVDTDHDAIDWEFTSGHMTWSIGNAVVQAVKGVRQQVLSYVAQALGEPVANLDIIDGNIVSYRKDSDISLSLLDLLASGVEAADGIQVSFEGKGYFEPTARSAPSADALGMPIPPIIHFSTGAQAAEVEIDAETGAVQVIRMAPAFDVGHALNPDIVRAQMKGGAVQGLSMALLENIQFDNGIPQNDMFFDYRIATIGDSPKHIDPIIVEVPQDDGPFGARGISEHVMISAAPAIASAISDALGIYLDELPITAEHIWTALMEKAEST